MFSCFYAIKLQLCDKSTLQSCQALLRFQFSIFYPVLVLPSLLKIAVKDYLNVFPISRWHPVFVRKMQASARGK